MSGDAAGRVLVIEPVIETYDIDFMHHVSNITYVRWMEQGRCRLLDAVGMSVPTIEAQGFGPVLVETQITYKKELRLGDRVRIECWLSKLTGVTATLEFRFHRDEELVATGSQRGLFVDLTTGRPRRLSDDDREKFAVYLHSERE